MDLVACLDQAVLDWREDPRQTYEVAVGLALNASQRAADSAHAEAASAIRDVFATLAERIHSFRGKTGELEAVQAHRYIDEALNDWEAGGRDDVESYATRWLGRIGPIDAALLDTAPRPLGKRGLLIRLRRRGVRRLDD